MRLRMGTAGDGRAPRGAAQAALVGAALAALLHASSAAAQQAGPDGRVAYPAAWFTQFSPTDALAMAERVPGFVIENGEEVRGLAGSAGNVVINGERPSAKSQTLEETLRRIPASQVQRMEVVPGELLGADYQARAQVLNVVLVPGSAGLAGSVAGGVQIPYTGVVTPFGSGSVLIRRGQHAFNGGLVYEANTNPDEGYDVLTAAPSGVLIERRDKVNRYSFKQLSLTGSWRWTGDAERSTGVNGRAWGWRNPLEHVSAVTNAAGPLRNDTIDQSPKHLGLELGGDVQRPVAGGVGRLVLLGRRERRDNEEIIAGTAAGGQFLGGLAQALERQTGESVARLTWTRQDADGWRIEAGGETALNTLDSQVSLDRLTSGGGRVPVPLPTSDVQVRELRGEVFATAGRRVSERVQLDLGLAVERSALTVTGDAEAERTLTFFKPRASLEWRPDDRWRFRGALERLVGQLNFDDFVSSAELANDRVTAANPEIEPERTWRTSVLLERKLLGDGQIRVTLYHDAVQRVLDRVPTDVGVDAPGNLDDGRRLWAETVLDVPLDWAQVAGGRFNLRWILQESDVRDPYTGRGRYFSGEVPWLLTATFRQTVPAKNLSWGLDYIADGENANFRVNEIDRFSSENFNVGLFTEFRPAPRFTANLRLNNIFNRDLYRDRDFYRPDRRTPEPYAQETRLRTQGRALTATLTRSIG